VTLPTAIPPPPAKEVAEKKEESEEKSELQPSPPMATASETTAPTSASVRSASQETWKTRLSAHLQKYKRYPHAAALRGERGIVELTFTVDREGHVTSARIHHGSGHPSLDEETVAMVHRAQPLPRPPGDVAGREFVFTLPVRFKPR
jgi:protein TonB